jgi:hypothetical protein
MQPVTKIEGLQLTAVATVSENRLTLDDAPYRCSHFTWMPDLDIMRQHDINAYFAPGSVFSSLRKYLACLVHKRPNLRFCALGPETLHTTKCIINVLTRCDIGSLFNEYAVIVTNGSARDEAREAFADDRPVRIQILDAEAELIAGESQVSYDVVIVYVGYFVIDELCEELARIRTLQKAGGKLILTNMRSRETENPQIQFN